jgi:hypothetical protein
MLKTSLIHLSANHWVTSIRKEDIIKSNDLWKEREWALYDGHSLDVYIIQSPAMAWGTKSHSLRFALTWFRNRLIINTCRLAFKFYHFEDSSSEYKWHKSDPDTESGNHRISECIIASSAVNGKAELYRYVIKSWIKVRYTTYVIWLVLDVTWC